MIKVDIDAVGTLLRDVARREILPRWRNLAKAEIAEKSGPLDLVTIADTATEEALKIELGRRYPGTHVTGEETFAADPDALARLATDGTVWVIDPVDGTRAFAEGRETFGSMLVLVDKGAPVAAWIYQPVADRLYLAEKGSGVFRVQGEGTRTRIAPPVPRRIADMAGIASGNLYVDGRRIYREKVGHRFAGLRGMTCPANDYPSILEGEAHFSVYSRCMPWDHLPGVTLLVEAGWCYAKIDRTPYRVSDVTGGVMSAPGADLWEDIRRAMAA